MPSKKSPAEPRTVRDFIFRLERRFARARLYFGHGTGNARDEAAWLVASALEIPFGELDAHAARVLTEPERKIVLDLAETRTASRKPLAYLLHEAWFAGLKF
jgi:ribosomal protein L3 glutamine methyltransferase